MKLSFTTKNKRYIAVIFAVCALGLTRCNKFVDGYEIDPSRQTQAPAPTLLTSAQATLGLAYTGPLSFMSSFFMQQIGGSAALPNKMARYELTGQDVAPAWERLYGYTLADLNDLIKQAESKDAAAAYAVQRYVGMAKIMRAMAIGLTTDLWGDVPFSGAASTNPEPPCDAQAQIYQQIQQDLTDAVAHLRAPVASGQQIPSGDDLFFGGNAQKWIRIAFVLKARYYNRLSKIDPSGSAQNALAALDSAYANGLASSEGNMWAKFGLALGQSNYWYQRNIQASPNILCATYVDSLKAYADPRLKFYAGAATAPVDSLSLYRGVKSGVVGNTTAYSLPGAYFTTPNASFPLVTFAEAKFIEAEVALRSGQTARAVSAYNDALKAGTATYPLTNYGVKQSEIDAFYTKNAVSSNNISLWQIITQKYLASFTQIETWTDWRRTGFPALTAVSGAAYPQIPRILPSSFAEINANPNYKPVISDLNARVWWDAP